MIEFIYGYHQYPEVQSRNLHYDGTVHTRWSNDTTDGTRSFSIKTQRGIRIVHEHRIRKSWADEQFAVDGKEDNEFEDLLDDFGRVDGIFDGKNNWSEVMKELLMTDTYSITEDNDDITVGDDATKFDLAYIVGKKDTWCQTTESART